MSITQLFITKEDQSALISRTIETAPTELMAREFIHNAYHAGATEVDFKIEKDPFGKERLCVWNNGRGMTKSEITDFVTKFAHTNTDGGKTHGVGGRLVGLRVSPAGMIVETCKSGTVLRGSIAKHGSSYGSTGEIDNVSREFDAVDKMSDWTRIFFVGKSSRNSVDDCLFGIFGRGSANGERPYKPGAFANQTAFRYFRMPGGIRASQRSEWGLFAHKGKSEDLPCMFDLMSYRECKYGSVETENLIIHYTLLPNPKDGQGGRNFYYKDVQVIGGFGGVVVDGEVFDLNSKMRWQQLATKFHLGVISKVCAVAVELKNTDGIVVNTERTFVNYVGGKRIEIDDFKSEIRENRPQFILDEIERLQNQSSSSEELRRRLVEFMQSLNVSSRVLNVDNNGAETVSNIDGALSPSDDHDGTAKIKNIKNKVKEPGAERKASPKLRIAIPQVCFYFEGNEEAIKNLPFGKSPICVESSDYLTMNDFVIHINATHKDIANMRSKVFASVTAPAPNWPKESFEKIQEDETLFDDLFKKVIGSSFGFRVAAGIISQLYASNYSEDPDQYKQMLRSSENVAQHAVIASVESQREIVKDIRAIIKGQPC